jgi:hypothetical protein
MSASGAGGDAFVNLQHAALRIEQEAGGQANILAAVE